MTRFARAGSRRFAPRNDAEPLRERARSLIRIRLSNSLRFLRSLACSAASCKMAEDQLSDCARVSVLATADARHRPVSGPAPGLAGHPVPHLPSRGVRNDRAYSPRPQRPHVLAYGQPARRFRGCTRAVAQPNAEDRWAEPGRGSRSSPAFRTRNGLCGLLHVPGVVTGADAPPFVRAVARTCTWAVRPLSPASLFSKDRRSSLRPGSGIVAAIRIPLPRIEDDRDAPLTGAGCRRRYKSYREDQEQKANKRQLFFLRIRKSIERGNHETHFPYRNAMTCSHREAAFERIGFAASRAMVQNIRAIGLMVRCLSHSSPTGRLVVGKRTAKAVRVGCGLGYRNRAAGRIVRNGPAASRLFRK